MKNVKAKEQKLLRFLESGFSAWKDADHPELANGAAAWVRGLRRKNDDRRGKKRRSAKR
jgi:hypothetical protein